MEKELAQFAPPFERELWSKKDQIHLEPFVTNTDESVYATLIFFPEIIGALSSRSSRATQDLRKIFLDEFLYPFLYPEREEGDTEEKWGEKRRYSEALRELLMLMRHHGHIELLQNPKARSFYLKWLAQYGDDSIAQMAGTHLVYCGLSQPAIKHLEDQRIGLAPIEKSTRYVDYSRKVAGQYLYYTDPTLQEFGVEKEYRAAMDGLFDAYVVLIPKMQETLAARFPNERPPAIRAKSFDVLRGLLPAATLSQVAFFGNGQAFEYLYNRCARHPLGEVQWAGERAHEELSKVIPAFLRRVKEEAAQEYQQYLADRKTRMASLVKEEFTGHAISSAAGVSVRLLEYDPEGEQKVIAGMLYDAPGTHCSWDEALAKVRTMPQQERRRVVSEYFRGRTQRWQKVGRALENTYVRFEIVMNIGAWRDLHRHRMLTQQRQLFSCHHGYDIPQEIVEAGFEKEYREAMERAQKIFSAIEAKDPWIAQYAVPLAHRVRFQQWQNLRAFFWEAELRTIPEGHPDYRHIEQEKFRLLSAVFPLLCEHAKVNMNKYVFARRGQEERIVKKEKELKDSWQ